MLDAFECHVLIVGDDLLSNKQATVLGLPDTMVKSCDHHLGYTSKAAKRRIKIMRQRESGTYTDHCYALGFEISVSSAIDLSMRIGTEFSYSEWGHEPLWFALDELHNLKAYLTSYVKLQIRIVKVHFPVVPPRPSAPFRLFACYQVVPLLEAQLVQDVLVPIEVDERTQRCLKSLLGCPESPTRQYLLQNVHHNFAVSW